MKQLLIQGALILATLAWGGETAAFWGNDAEQGTSGLDYAKGFDINTVATVNGTVLHPPGERGQGHAVMEVRTGQGQMNVIVGPWWFWEKNVIPLNAGHEITITGSKAQGKDGGLYLLPRRSQTVQKDVPSPFVPKRALRSGRVPTRTIEPAAAANMAATALAVSAEALADTAGEDDAGTPITRLRDA